MNKNRQLRCTRPTHRRARRRRPLAPPRLASSPTAAHVYAGPGTDYAQVSTVEPGDVVELLVKVDALVVDPDRRYPGLGQFLAAAGRRRAKPHRRQRSSNTTPARIPDPAAISGLVTMAGAVYAGPGSDYATIANVEAGTTLELLGATGAWWQVWVGRKCRLDQRSTAADPARSLRATGHADADTAHPPAPAPAPAAPAAPVHRLHQQHRLRLNRSGRSRFVPGTLVRLPEVVAPKAYLYADVVRPFLRARTRVLRASGIDYLGRLDEAFRAVDYETTKQGVASMSWHKAGRAVDVAQSRGSMASRVSPLFATQSPRVCIAC